MQNPQFAMRSMVDKYALNFYIILFKSLQCHVKAEGEAKICTRLMSITFNQFCVFESQSVTVRFSHRLSLHILVEISGSLG